MLKGDNGALPLARREERGTLQLHYDFIAGNLEFQAMLNQQHHRLQWTAKNAGYVVDEAFGKCCKRN